jgi:uncharacterized protein YceK
MRLIKLFIAFSAVAALSGCGSFWEPTPVPEGYVGSYGTPQTRYDAEREAFWSNYRTPANGASSSTNGASAGGSTSPVGQCTSGAPAPCLLKDGSWGTCCASPQ